MPELPDLVYIKKRLDNRLPGRSILGVLVKQPIVLRTSLDRPIAELLTGATLSSIEIHGPFIVFRLSAHLALIINLMLAGRLHLQQAAEKPPGHLCIALSLDNGEIFSMSDDQKMGKLYVVREGDEASVPKYAEQGIDILGNQFTLEAFRALARANRRKQVRVFINDHSALSAVGNAYADEILFEARIHPKTFLSALPPESIDRLYEAVKQVMTWGIAEVEKAGQPIHVKVRGHLKVRNRKGEACPRCGGTIRREGVRGHDVFFCPHCQPASRKLFIDWGKL
jgi:formamidopyrimidine-DNA glycosylase